MTIGDFIKFLGENPSYVFIYFGFIVMTAFLAGVMGRGEGNQSPWNYLYATLLYLVCIPGIFAVAFSVYLFLFERISIFNTDINTQVLPILSMIMTIFIVKQNADISLIPGFGRLSSLVTIMVAVLMMMFFLDRVRIYVFSSMSMQELLLVFIVFIVIVRFAWSRFVR